MNRIKLDSRYGEENYLEEVAPDVYRLITENNYRMGYSEDETITFIDPSGGPFMERGSIVDGKKVVDIFRGEDNCPLIKLAKP